MRWLGEYTGRREETNVKVSALHSPKIQYSKRGLVQDILAWGSSFTEATVKEFDGDLTRLQKNMVTSHCCPAWESVRKCKRSRQCLRSSGLCR